MSRPCSFTEADDTVIRAGREAGLAYSVIAASLGCSGATCWARARNLGSTKHRTYRRKGHTKGSVPPRKCLFHGGMFQPGYRHQFICGECKKTDEWQHAMALA